VDCGQGGAQGDERRERGIGSRQWGGWRGLKGGVGWSTGAKQKPPPQ
jgi:hypothetical protein